MPDSVLWMPSSAWDAQPSKKRRVTMDDLERDFLKLSLSGKYSWRLQSENVELDTMLATLTLNASPSPCRRSGGVFGPMAPREAHSRCRERGPCTPVEETRGMGAEDCADKCGTRCTAIVPFNKPPQQRRWRRIPRITPIPRCPSGVLPARFAVDSEGTAFVLSNSVRSELFRTQDKWKRGHAEEQRNVTSTAIVIYQKPRKHDLVEDFMTLKL